MAELMRRSKTPHAGVGGDRTSLTLHPEDEALIRAVAAANPRTVVAIMAGSAVIMEAWRDKVAAILLLWYPGQEGGHAFADVLLGARQSERQAAVLVPRSAPTTCRSSTRTRRRSPTTSGTATGSSSATARRRRSRLASD